MIKVGLCLLTVVLVIIVCLTGNVGCQDQPDGYRLNRDASYMIVAPRQIHPNQVVQLSVNIMAMYYENINVRASIRRWSEEIAQAYQTFYTTGTQLMQMEIPENADGGNYTLRIEGTTSDGLGGYIFENETELLFSAKQCSLFIQVNKPFFRQGQKVLFRIMPIEKNLMSRSGSMDVYIVDSTNTIVRRWLSMQTNAGGVLNMEFPLSEQPHYGMWKIQVQAFGYTYEEPFRVDEFFITAIDVNVSIPIYMMEDEYGLGGVMSANVTHGGTAKGLSLGQPVLGRSKVKVDIWRPPGEREEGEGPITTVEHEERYFPGVQDFLFTMKELSEALEPFGESIADKELKVTAEVYDWFLIQSATGSAICVVYDNLVKLQLLGDTSRVFKPNQTMDVYYAAVHKDGTPLFRNRRQVTVDRSEEGSQGTRSFQDKFLVGDDGIAHYRFVPHEYATFITITAYYDNFNEDRIEVTAARHYSPTESYLYITSSTASPLVDQYMVFTVATNTFVERVHYVVTCGGNIITGGMLEMSSRQKTFALSVSRDMIPETHLVMWHVYQGEVIADSFNFFVNGTRINNLEARFSRGKDFTGDTVEVNSWTDPSSFIGFNGIDYELWAYGYGTFITESMVIEELRSYDTHMNSSFGWKWKLPEEEDHYVNFPAPNYGVDANQTFSYAGLLVFTDANVTRIPHYCNDTLGYHPCMDGSCYEEHERCDGARQCRDGQDEMGCVFPQQEIFTPSRERLGLVTRHYVMDGGWLWGSHFVMPNGRLDAMVEVPDEPMAWVLGAYGISKDLGFGMLHHPVRFQATRAFYMRIEAPSTEVIKGEMIGIRIGLFNYFVEDLECIVMLHGSDNYKFVVIEEYGIVSSYAPRTISGDIQTMMFLEKGHVYEIQIPVLPTGDGCFTVSITANAFIYGDHETLELCTKYDGVTNYLHTPYFIDLINSGSLVLPDLEIPVPERFIKPEERQHLYVPGSPQASVGIVGDVVGPGFFVEYLDAEATLRKPYGSAEQNMYNFAYTLYNLLYLRDSNQLKPEVLTKALDHLRLGLQRQLGYMNEDGSFSQFRDYQESTPSIWATAFAMETINHAQVRDWELDFFIPTELLNHIMNWLCDQQSNDGSFQEIAPIYDKKMRTNNTDSFALTAYVLITLVRSNRVTSEADQCRTSAISLAEKYLEDRFMSLPDESMDVFQMAIVTYALHLSDSQKSTEAFYRFDAMKRTDNYVYWADKEIPPNDIRTVDTIPYYQPRRWFDNEGYGVDTTSYGLLIYMQRNMITDAEPIMKWLQTMRNTYAGQASTQDSITCLQGLVAYAIADTNRHLYNIEVTVEATSMGNYSESVRLDSSNWVDLQQISVSPVWGSVRGRAQGSGIALMQLATNVNVEYPHQILPAAEGKYFDVEVKEFNYTGKNFSIMAIGPCAKWARPDLSNLSGMAVLEVHVPTGYIITNDVLRSYAQSGDVPTLRRAEAYDRKVVFYFDYLESARETCVKFRMDRWFPVANMTIQHLLKVYDYYEPGMHNTTLYNTYTLFNLHMCQVCGSFQCPYCRFYNTASSLHRHHPLVLFSSILTVYLLVSLLVRRTPQNLT